MRALLTVSGEQWDEKICTPAKVDGCIFWR